MKNIIVDFDGTIQPNVFPAFAPPISGAKEAIASLRSSGYKVYVHSCRWATYWEMCGDPAIPRMDQAIADVRKYLEQYQIEVDGLWLADKPVAVYYIDDRAIAFKGDWSAVLREILP